MKALIFKIPTTSELTVGLIVAYRDVFGEFTRTGTIEKVVNHEAPLSIEYKIGGAHYLADELRLIEQ